MIGAAYQWYRLDGSLGSVQLREFESASDLLRWFRQFNNKLKVLQIYTEGDGREKGYL